MKIEVKERTHSYACDDCGHYTDVEVVVLQDGKEVARVCSDGHLGSGDFDEFSPASAVAAVLRKLHPDSDVSLEM